MVSVVMPTWQRHDLLTFRAVPSVWHQDYAGTVELIVVSDGPDSDLRTCLAGYDFSAPLWRLVLDELPAHDPAVWFGNRARLRALELATGSVIAYLDDDNAWRPNHLSLLVGALEGREADFVFSQMFRHGLGDVVGYPPPRYAQVDSSILAHRAGLKPVGWKPGQRADPDWEAVEAWLNAGWIWAHVPQVTCDYHMRGYEGV